MPWQHSIAGGQGNLVANSVQSPNFVHLVQGWQIAKNGNSEFNNMTLRGTFNGTDFIINSSGAFFYKGTPAAANLIASIASAAGTEGFGNAYKAGICVYDSAAAGTFVQMLAGSPAAVNIGSGDVAEVTAGLLKAQILGSGTSRTIETVIRSATVPSQPAGGFSAVGVISYSPDFTNVPTAAMLATDGTNTNQVAVNTSGTFINLGPLTATAGTASKPTLITTDTPHSIAPLLVNGWGVTTMPLSYWLDANGNLVMQGQLRQSSAPTSNVIATLSGSYVPAHTGFIWCGATNGILSTASLYLQVNGSGVANPGQVTVNNLTLTGNPIVLVNGAINLAL